MILTRSGRQHAHHQQGTGHHSHRDPRALGALASYRSALRGGGQRSPYPPGEELTRGTGEEAAREDAGTGDLGDEHRGDHGSDPRRELSSVLVDSNVILDIVTEDPQWVEWSSSMVARCVEGGTLI